MNQPCDSREMSNSDMEDASKVPSVQADGSSSVTDEEGWPACNSRSRCRRPKWTREEEMVLVEAHCTLGNAWVAIAECLPGRTPSEVKNIWHSTLRARKLQTRSVLRAYVTALKDRADKPVARQQAMRAAQHFLSEGSNKVCSPAKRGPKKTAAQQQQQQRLPQLRTAGAPDSPPQPQPLAGEASGAHSEAELTDGAPAPGRTFTAMEALSRGADGSGPVGHAGLSTAAAGLPGAGAVHKAATGHRSSLGSALESWPLAARSGSCGGARSGSGGGAPPASGPSGGGAAAAGQVLSFSPLMAPVTAALSAASAYAQPHAVAARSSPAVVTTSGAGSRYNSPSLRPDSPPLPMQPLPMQPRQQQPQQHQQHATGLAHYAGLAGGDCAASDWRGDGMNRGRASSGGANDVAMRYDGATAAPAVDWMAPGIPVSIACSQAPGQQRPLPHPQQQQQQRMEGPSWHCGTLGSWEQARFPSVEQRQQSQQPYPARGGYVVSTGCTGSSGGGVGTWGDAGRYPANPTSAPLLSTGERAAALAAAPAAALTAAARTGAGAPSFAHTLPHQAVPAGAPQRRGSAPPILSAFDSGAGPAGHGGGGAGSSSGSAAVVTMGLCGILDEDLLACLRS